MEVLEFLVVSEGAAGGESVRQMIGGLGSTRVMVIRHPGSILPGNDDLPRFRIIPGQYLVVSVLSRRCGFLLSSELGHINEDRCCAVMKRALSTSVSLRLHRSSVRIWSAPCVYLEGLCMVTTDGSLAPSLGSRMISSFREPRPSPAWFGGPPEIP